MSIKAMIALAAFLTTFSTALFAQTLLFCSEGSPEGFDPALYLSPTTWDASSQPIYDRLTAFKAGTTEVIPSLAESWDISDDGKAVTFHLREGVQFHANSHFTPTRNFNADDVIYSFDRQRDDDALYNYATGRSWDYFTGMSMPDLIERIEKVDDNTVTFHLVRAEAPFLATVAMDFTSIVSQEYAKAMNDAGTPELVNRAPIGTGPFIFESFQHDVVVRYARNDNYWGDLAKVERLIFVITPNSFDRYDKVKTGECHVMAYPNRAKITDMQLDGDFVVLSQAGLNVGYLAYNTQVPPFDNVNVRRALNMAINKDRIVNTVFGSSGQIARNPFPPTMWAYNTDIVDDDYDPDTAKAMLVTEGVADLRLKIWAMPVPRLFNPDAQRMAELIQDDLNQIGVPVEIMTYDWDEYLDRSMDRDRDGAVLLGWTGDNGDPDNFLGALLSCDSVEGTNIAQWCHAGFDSLVQEARTLKTQAERARLYRDAQEIFKREAPWATIAHSVAHVVTRPEVENYVMDPFGRHNFNAVGIAE